MYLGENIKKLGFGLMRLPMLGDEVDLEQTKQMVDLFLQKGFTYFDTAFGYLDGKSEAAIKLALVDRYPRDKFLLATKLPAWSGVKTTEAAQQQFFTSLERTGAGYFDFYLLHNLGDSRTQTFDDFQIWDFLAEQKKKGLIRHLGFSIHDTADKLEEVLTKHPEMEFVQLQINYADWEDKLIQSRACYETARRHGKPVIIMEPVKGGTLAKLPPDITKIFKDAKPDASLPSWAIRYAASLEGLVTVLSGMSNLEQMQDNLSFMSDFKPLDKEERCVIENVREALEKIPTIPCTACSYCTKNCPQHIVIPQIFAAMNTYLTFDQLKGAKNDYNWETRLGGKGSQCIECGQCEDACPQHIKIIEELKRAVAIFE
ncbi:MAG: aldo/keto reductase [Oscillospiraceae bacterium]